MTDNAFGLNYWRELKKRNSVKFVTGPPGVGFKLTNDGNYDVQDKKIVNLNNPEDEKDVVNLKFLQEYHNSQKQDIFQKVKEFKTDVDQLQEIVKQQNEKMVQSKLLYETNLQNVNVINNKVKFLSSRLSFIAGLDSLKIDNTLNNKAFLNLNVIQSAYFTEATEYFFIFKTDGFFEVNVSFLSDTKIPKCFMCIYDEIPFHSITLHDVGIWDNMYKDLLTTYSFCMEAKLGGKIMFSLLLANTAIAKEEEIKNLKLFIRPL